MPTERRTENEDEHVIIANNLYASRAFEDLEKLLLVAGEACISPTVRNQRIFGTLLDNSYQQVDDLVFYVCSVFSCFLQLFIVWFSGPQLLLACDINYAIQPLSSLTNCN